VARAHRRRTVAAGVGLAGRFPERRRMPLHGLLGSATLCHIAPFFCCACVPAAANGSRSCSAAGPAAASWPRRSPLCGSPMPWRSPQCNLRVRRCGGRPACPHEGVRTRRAHHTSLGTGYTALLRHVAGRPGLRMPRPPCPSRPAQRLELSSGFGTRGMVGDGKVDRYRFAARIEAHAVSSRGGKLVAGMESHVGLQLFRR
jgi:hypothetical protein